MAGGYCPKSEDGWHCVCWFGLEKCHSCGYDGINDYDDSPRHKPELEGVQEK